MLSYPFQSSVNLSCGKSRGLWTRPSWVICAPAFNHEIGTFTQFRASYKCCAFRHLTSGSNNSRRNGRQEGYSTEQAITRDLHRCTKSRWLTDRSDNNGDYNSFMWLAMLCLFWVVSVQQFLRYRCCKYVWGIKSKYLVYITLGSISLAKHIEPKQLFCKSTKLIKLFMRLAQL